MTSELSNIGKLQQSSSLQTQPATRSDSVRDHKKELQDAQDIRRDDTRQVQQENQLKQGEHVEPVQQAELESVIANINEVAQSMKRELSFSINEGSNESGNLVIEVRDSETKEVIRQIPSEAALRIAEGIEAAQKNLGLLFTAQA